MTSKTTVGLGRTEAIIRASWVKRFHLLPMSVTQNIAEHQWNVAMLFLTVWPTIAASDQRPATIHPTQAMSVGLQWALVHDLPESFTGDLPTHIKHFDPCVKEALDKVERLVTPGWWNDIADLINSPEFVLVKRVVKACDIADTLRGCRYVQNPVARDWVHHAMLERFEAAIEGLPPHLVSTLQEYYQRG